MIEKVANELYENILSQLSIGVCVVDEDLSIVYVNDFFFDRIESNEKPEIGESILKYVPNQNDFIKRKIKSVFVLKNSTFSYWEQRPFIFNFKSSRPITGEECEMFQNVEIYPIYNDNTELKHACITVYDMTVTASYRNNLMLANTKVENEKKQQQVLIKKLEDAQNQLLQSEKMASIGQLSAGVAHEINNPIGFIFSNLQSLNNYAVKIVKYVEFLRKISEKNADDTTKNMIVDYSSRNHISMILDDVNELISESIDGAERVMEIVKSLREFSHVDSAEWVDADITKCIDSTLKIVNNEIKYKAEIIIEYDDDLPRIICQPMQLNQVFMNIILNASQSITDFGFIKIKCYTHQEYYVVKITDNGCGISKENLNRIFEPFYTTKDVGKGTGLGLSLSYGIINQHGGSIKVDSEVGAGTVFTISIPIDRDL